MSHTYKELVAWQKAKRLAVEVYRASEDFPRSELFGLTSQIRRAAVSAPSNIAEGQGRLSKGEFRHFLGMARGSLVELETQLSIAVDLNFLSQDDFARLERLIGDVLGLVNRLIDSLGTASSAAGA